jgi:hypothetical protein
MNFTYCLWLLRSLGTSGDDLRFFSSRDLWRWRSSLSFFFSLSAFGGSFSSISFSSSSSSKSCTILFEKKKFRFNKKMKLFDSYVYCLFANSALRRSASLASSAFCSAIFFRSYSPIPNASRNFRFFSSFACANWWVSLELKHPTNIQ